MKVLAPVLVLASAVSGAEVTCKLTIDNHVTSVHYNDIALENTGRVKYKGAANWLDAKIYTFTEVAGAHLDVIGREDGGQGTCLGTECSGFAMECQDTNGGAWNKFASRIDGTCAISLVDDSKPRSEWQTYKPAETSSLFSLRDSFGTGHTEIWGEHAKHNNNILFSCAPQHVRDAAAAATATAAAEEAAQKKVIEDAAKAVDAIHAAAAVRAEDERANPCAAKFCGTWGCAQWCKCFNVEDQDVYPKYDCLDDGDSCSCN